MCLLAVSNGYEIECEVLAAQARVVPRLCVEIRMF